MILLYPVHRAEVGQVTPAYPYGDVRRYGAVGDGVANDTAAIQAALDSVHGMKSGEVYIPVGTYLVDTLTVPGNNITVRGHGSAYVYNTAATPRTTLKARSGVPHVINLANRGDCLLTGFRVDGDLKAGTGIVASADNLLDGVAVRGCLRAGLRLTDLTNSTHITRCGFVDNFGWGVHVEGANSTTFSMVDSNVSLNQAGGVLLEAGQLVEVRSVVIESNGGPGLRIFRPSSMTGTFAGLAFHNVWLEDNRGTNTLEIDAHTRREVFAPSKIHFTNCRFNTGRPTGRRHMNIQCASSVTFENCQFDAARGTDAVTLGREARFVAFLESTRRADSPSPDQPRYAGLSDAQVDAAIAAGTRCYASDRQTRRTVGASGKPPFENGWSNAGSGYATAKYWFDREGNVCLEGVVTGGSIARRAFLLPPGYRPPSTVRLAATSDAAPATLEIRVDGSVIPLAGSTATFSLDSARFATG